MRIPAHAVIAVVAGPALALSGLATSSASAAPEVTTTVSLSKGDASYTAEMDWRPRHVSSYGTLSDACRQDKKGSVRIVWTARASNSKDPVTQFQTRKACNSRDLNYLVDTPRKSQRITGIRIQVCNMVRGRATTCVTRLFDNPTV